MDQQKNNKKLQWYKRIIYLCICALLIIGGLLWFGKSSAIYLNNPKVVALTHTLRVAPNETVNAIYVREQQHIQAGMPLFSYAAEAEQAELAKAKHTLVELEAFLPAQAIEGMAEADALGDVAPLGLQQKLASQEEAKARQFKEELSIELASARLQAYRLGQQHPKTQEALLQLAAAQERVLDLERMTTLAAEAHEKQSLRRATIESDMRLIRAMQSKQGISAIPESQRVAMYEAQAATVLHLQKIVNNKTTLAPFAALVQKVSPVQSLITSDMPILTLQQEGGALFIVGSLPQKTALALRMGQPCQIKIGNDSSIYKGQLQNYGTQEASPEELCTPAQPELEGSNMSSVFDNATPSEKEIAICVKVTALAQPTSTTNATEAPLPAAIAGTEASVWFSQSAQ